MTEEDLEAWRELVVEQGVLWRLRRVLDVELEAVQKKMIEVVGREGFSALPRSEKLPSG